MSVKWKRNSDINSRLVTFCREELIEMLCLYVSLFLLYFFFFCFILFLFFVFVFVFVFVFLACLFFLFQLLTNMVTFKN